MSKLKPTLSELLLKWGGTFLLIFGSWLNAIAAYPYGPLVNIIGGFMWLVVAVRWKDNALIATNLTLSIVTVAGLMVTYL